MAALINTMLVLPASPPPRAPRTPKYTPNLYDYQGFSPFDAKPARPVSTKKETFDWSHTGLDPAAPPKFRRELLREGLGLNRTSPSVQSLTSLLGPQAASPQAKNNTRKPQHQNRKSATDPILDRHSRARGGPFAKARPGKTSTSYQLRQFAEATLGGDSLRKAVKLPEGEDLDEWLAVNVVDFYNQINLLYGSITEFCSPQTCPEMKATDEFEYLWQDSENYKKPTKMPAPEYVEHLMSWCQANIDNEQMFPSRLGVPFPKAFGSLVRTMFKRLYRVYAHIYCHHYPVIIQLGLEPHLNTSFKHYVLFIDEHQLATGKDYWGPLGDLVESLLRTDGTRAAA